MTNSGTEGYAVSFILPAYNEEACIESAVTDALAALRKYTSRFEIIVVDDGSADATPELLAKLDASVPELRVIRHERNIGYGAALRTGFKAAKMPLVFYTDSDCQFDINEIERSLPLSKDYDVVTGYRIRRKDTLLRYLVSRCYNLLVRLLIGITVRDVNCSFKLFHRNVFDSFEVESNEFFVDAEILAKARALGFTICEIGVTHFPRRAGIPTVRVSNVPRTLRELSRIRNSIKKLRPINNPSGKGGR
jgi:glycosyltransferase involved in cell wall biosynthesis